MQNARKYLYIKIVIILVLIVFASWYLYYSFTDLSINIQQCLYGWENSYGFYDSEQAGGTYFRWTEEQASEVVWRNGSSIIIPLKAGNPDLEENPLDVKIYIDNLPKRVVEINDDQWVYIEIDISYIDRDKFTLTIDTSRTWVPSDWGISSDSRDLGISLGEISYK